MVDCCLQELGNLIHNFPVLHVIEPPQLGNAADQLNEGGDHKVVQVGPLAGQVGQDVVANVHTLRRTEVVPVRGDELGEGGAGQQEGIP